MLVEPQSVIAGLLEGCCSLIPLAKVKHTAWVGQEEKKYNISSIISFSSISSISGISSTCVGVRVEESWVEISVELR
jgi:hypothetical protein